MKKATVMLSDDNLRWLKAGAKNSKRLSDFLNEILDAHRQHGPSVDERLARLESLLRVKEGA